MDRDRPTSNGDQGERSRGRAESIEGPNEEDLEHFAQTCKQFYFGVNPPAECSRVIASTLAAIPPDHREVYARTQSSLRSQAHRHHHRLRVESFQALLNSTRSLNASPHERRRLLQAFVVKYHSAGTEPFFRGLWAALRLQSRRQGGAGNRRLVWEIDDAVFQETGGLDFMREAVIILKGVLGLADQFTSGNLDPFSVSEDQLLEFEDADESGLNQPRLWVFPAHMDNQEAEDLLVILPSLSRGKRKDAKFPTASLEDGLTTVEGTGRMWIGIDPRDAGWEGSRWFRLKRWIRAWFGMA